MSEVWMWQVWYRHWLPYNDCITMLHRTGILIPKHKFFRCPFITGPACGDCPWRQICEFFLFKIPFMMCVLWLCAHACMCVHQHTHVCVCVHLHMHVHMHSCSCPHQVCLRMHHGCIGACLCVRSPHCSFTPHYTLVARKSVHLTVCLCSTLENWPFPHCI